jgi:Thiamine pyrophosphate enzyme, C-terminal TPP binding domain
VIIMPLPKVKAGLAAAAAPGFVLERSEVMPALIGRHEDFLFVTGLGGSASDVGAVIGDGAHVYSLGGAMGAACMIGLGLALARPDKRVLVVTGDGELLMNIGALATIAVMNPANLSILCVDNGHYGETGWQRRATPAWASISRRWRPAPASSARARWRSRTTSPKARVCCGRATARASWWCACGRPSRRSSSATSMPRSAATASAPPCGGPEF